MLLESRRRPPFIDSHQSPTFMSSPFDKLCDLNFFQSGDDGTLTWEDSHLDVIRKWSAAAESLIHGRASGLDAAVCTYGTRFLPFPLLPFFYSPVCRRVGLDLLSINRFTCASVI